MKPLSKSRYRGTILLAFAIVFTGFLNFLFSQYNLADFPPADGKADARQLDSILALLEAKGDQFSEETGENENADFQLKPFNPNFINRQDWLAMQLPEKAFESLERYRQKGGIFRHPDQIYKVPHLSREEAEEIREFVLLDSARSGNRPKASGPFARKDQGSPKPFDLNEADSLQLKSIFGIGSKTASRIIQYRKDLGGFVRKEQLYEIWGLDSLVAGELIDLCYLSERFRVRPINPNTATEDELASHPYIRRGLARLIIRYRKQHPAFSQSEDLLGIRLIKPEQIEKLRPYLTF